MPIENAGATREAWLQARLALLEKEKAYVRAGDELDAQRRNV